MEQRKIKTEGNVDPATIVELNLQLLQDQQDCDVVFVVGQDTVIFQAHKLILTLRSTYFEAKFSGRWASDSNEDGNRKEIILEYEDPSVIQSFLEHTYAYVFKASPVEAVKLLHLAQYYQVPTLASRCEERLAKPFQADDLLEIFVIAKKFRLTDVVNKAGKTMANYFTQLANSPTFEKADEAMLIYLLEREDLNIEESKLFFVLLSWADKQIESSVEDPNPERRGLLKNLIPLVRFPTMDSQDFAQVVASTDFLSVQTQRDLFLYMNWGNEERETIAKRFPYSTVPRVSEMYSCDFYMQVPRPGSGTYLDVALKKQSNVQDTLKISFNDTGILGGSRKIVSVVLEPPRYDQALFQNSFEVAAMNLPIKVAVSCSETKGRDAQPTWTSEEVVANLESRQVVLTLDKPWILSLDNANTYRITTRFLSDVYTVPEVVGDGSQDGTLSPRDENFDFFTATTLGGILSMSGGSATSAGASAARTTSLSSGLHVIRSMQIVA